MGDWRDAAVDGVPLAAYGFVLTSQEMSGPAPRASLVDVPGRDGFADATARPGGWPSLAPAGLSLGLSHLSGGDRDMVRDLSRLRAAILGRRVRYRPWDAPEPEWWLDCVCTSVEVEGRSARHMAARVEMTCDPALHGRRVEVALRRGTTSLRVGGNRPTAPALSLAASGGRVSAAYAATGESVSTVASLAAGARVAMDMGARLATVGEAPAAVTLASDYWRLEPGWCEVAVSGASGTMAYDERWL